MKGRNVSFRDVVDGDLPEEAALHPVSTSARVALGEWVGGVFMTAGAVLLFPDRRPTILALALLFASFEAFMFLALLGVILVRRRRR